MSAKDAANPAKVKAIAAWIDKIRMTGGSTPSTQLARDFLLEGLDGSPSADVVHGSYGSGKIWCDGHRYKIEGELVTTKIPEVTCPACAAALKKR